MKSSKLTTLICGLISIVATVTFYLLTFDNIFAVPMRWLSLIFLLITEVIGTVKAILPKKDIIVLTCIFTSCAHLAAVLVISILFVNLFPLSLKTYILLNVLMLCVLAITDLIVLFFGKNMSSGNKELKESQGVMNACYEKAQSLVVMYGQSGCVKDLVEIAELIRFSDNSSLTGDEAIIMNKLDELGVQLEAGNNAATLITEIKNAIKLRTIKIKSVKRGGY